jgi:hypothetical protein
MLHQASLAFEPQHLQSHARAGLNGKSCAPCRPPEVVHEEGAGAGCVLCSAPDFLRGAFGARTIILCDTCEREFHVGCLRTQGHCDLHEVRREWSGRTAARSSRGCTQPLPSAAELVIDCVRLLTCRCSCRRATGTAHQAACQSRHSWVHGWQLGSAA